MADIKTREERSRNMSAIKSKNTKPEMYIRKLIFSLGYRYRIHSKSVPGHPDLWLRKHNVAIFVNGCFWHRHNGCKYAYTPKTRKEFWEQKFSNNIQRDADVLNELKAKKIRTLIIWECTINKMMSSDSTQKEITQAIVRFLESKEEVLEM